MAKPNKRNKRQKQEKIKRNCRFCHLKTEPDYKNYQELKESISDRERILPASRSGVCAKHQRRLSKEIKRARILGLLPFTERA